MNHLEKVTANVIADGGYVVKDNIFKYDYLKFNELLGTYNNTHDAIEKEIIFDQMVTVVTCIMFGGRDPKTVPTSAIKRACQNPSTGADSRADLDARARVRNPNTGIRAKCITCMGGQPGYVRDCPSIRCPLWPFRMATNPFYARLVDTDADAEIVEDYEAEEALEDADKQTSE